MKLSQTLTVLLPLCLSMACRSAEVMGTMADLESMAISAIDQLLESESSLERKLQGEGGMNDPCSEKSDCGKGYECVDVFVGKKCKPVDCMVKAVESVNATFNLDVYKMTLLNAAQFVDDEQLLQEATSWQMALTVVDGGPIARLNEALRANPFPHKEFREAFVKCQEETGQGDEQTNQGVSVCGVQFEAGAIANINFSILSASSDTDPQSAILNRFCFGPKFGGGATVQVVTGLYSVPSYQNMTGCSSVTSYGLSAGLGLAFNQVCLLSGGDGLETLFGLGTGAGVGWSTCVTSLQ